ncbi:MAG: apolipoprotein N-acyltransferase [Burkholderiales bacterium]|nr:apolipoprotein N-acyltransferase [Burkholderiales bacterium]
MRRLRLHDRLWWGAIGGGCLHAFALTPWVAQVWPPLSALLQTAGLICLLVLLSGPVSARRGAVCAWLYSTAWLIGGTGWIYVSLHRYGELPAWLSALSVLALSLFLSSFMAAAAWCWLAWRRLQVWRDALAWAGLWLLAEVTRALIFTGFPWAVSGYGLVDVGWRLAAPWVGVYGAGALWAGVVAWLVLGWRLSQSHPDAQRAPAKWALAMLVLVVTLMWQPASSILTFTRAVGHPLSVTLLQGNVPQDEKFVPELQVPMLIWYARELAQAQTDLVVAPETAVPLLPSQLPDDYWRGLTHAFQAPGRHALFGVPLGSFESGYTNSVAGMSAQAAQMPDGFYRYNKHHLVPFGEFIPLGFHWFVAMMNMPLGDFARGPLVSPSFEVSGQRVAPTICYEDLYGEEIAARFVDAGKAPTVLANVSNLAWFGEDVAIFQHQQIARMRSLEFQIPTIRATNTGATMIVDHDGRIVRRLQPNTRGALVSSVQGYEGVTPYAWWAGRWGLWPLVLLGLMVAIPFNRIGLLRR